MQGRYQIYLAYHGHKFESFSLGEQPFPNAVVKISYSSFNIELVPGDTDISFKEEASLELQYHQGGLRVLKVDRFS